MRIIECEQGTEAWHKARAGNATASCFADILATIKNGEAAARRNYRAKLVVERLTGKVIEGFKSAAMQQGIEREPLARAAYSAATEHWVEQVGFMFDDLHQAGCSPDGTIGDDGLVEIKCPEPATHMEYLRRPDEPTEYRAQIQGQLWISGRQWCDFVSWNPDFPPKLQLVIRRVERNEVHITSLQLAVAMFMAEVKEEVAAMEKLAA